MSDAPDDEPRPDGYPVECWSCGGEGGHEGTDPFWDLGEWIECDICGGEGGWICEAVGSDDAQV